MHVDHVVGLFHLFWLLHSSCFTVLWHLWLLQVLSQGDRCHVPRGCLATGKLVYLHVLIAVDVITITTKEIHVQYNHVYLICTNCYRYLNHIFTVVKATVWRHLPSHTPPKAPAYVCNKQKVLSDLKILFIFTSKWCTNSWLLIYMTEKYMHYYNV